MSEELPTLEFYQDNQLIRLIPVQNLCHEGGKRTASL